MEGKTRLIQLLQEHEETQMIILLTIMVGRSYFNFGRLLTLVLESFTRSRKAKSFLEWKRSLPIDTCATIIRTWNQGELFEDRNEFKSTDINTFKMKIRI